MVENRSRRSEYYTRDLAFTESTINVMNDLLDDPDSAAVSGISCPSLCRFGGAGGNWGGIGW